MITKKHLILCFFTICIFLLAYTPKARAATSTDRIAGYDRYQTAVAVSQSGWPAGADCAILAYGEDFPDALSAGPLAHKYNAPILLTGSAALNSDTANELKRLMVKRVYVIGGYAVISKEVNNELSSMDITVVRIYGQDRYETSLKVAQKVGLTKGVFVANGTEFPDALSAGPIAAANEMPLLLVPPDDLTKSQKSLIDKTKIPVSYIVTGNSDLSDNVIQRFPNYEVIGGEDAFERNINLMTNFGDNLNFDTIYVATGENFPDALAASALASLNNNPILLTKGNTIPDSTLSFMNSNIISELRIIGGTSVINDSTATTLASLPPQIASVKDISDFVQEKQAYEPPKTVTVTTTKGTEAKVPVTWTLSSVTSLSSGIYDYEGTIKGYSDKVHLSLNVTPTWNKISAETVQNGNFSFPTTVDAVMNDKTVKSLPVTWDITTANLNKVGTYTFHGTVPDLDQKITLTLKVTEDAPIDFPDTALKTVVCHTLGKPTDTTIYKSDALNVTDLFASNSGITDLTGLEYFTNLKNLYLGNNNLSSITPLRKLTNLKHLELRECGLKDLGALKGLTSLTYLDAASNNISDFSPLEQLTHLTVLYLRDNATLNYDPVRSYYNNLTGKDFYL